MFRLSPSLSVYIARNFLVAFGGAVSVVMGLILLFDVVELMRRLSVRGIDLATILSLGMMKLPQMMHVVLPFAVMIGGMIAFWRMTRSHELLVARAAGVSVWGLLAPVMAVVLLLGIFNVALINPLAAALYSRYEQSIDRLLVEKPAKGQGGALTFGESGLWLRENRDGNVIVVHADHVRQEDMRLRLRDVSLLYILPDGTFSHRLDARLGALEQTPEGGHFDLQQVYLMKPGQPSEYFKSKRLPTNLTLETIQDKFAAPEAISFWQLPKFITFFEQSGFSALRQKIYWHSLIASPLLLCSMVLIAAIFSLQPNLRSGGLMWRVVGGVSAGFLFYFFSKIVYALGQSSSLPLMLAAWAPVMVAGLIGTATLFHLEDG